MKFLLDLRESTEKKLDRQLQEKELEFLNWVYARYVEEQNKGVKSKSVS